MTTKVADQYADIAKRLNELEGKAPLPMPDPFIVNSLADWKLVVPGSVVYATDLGMAVISS